MTNHKSLYYGIFFTIVFIFTFGCSEKTSFEKLHDGDGGYTIKNENSENISPDKKDTDNQDTDTEEDVEPNEKPDKAETDPDIDDDNPDSDSDKEIEEDGPDVDTELENSIDKSDSLLPDTDITICEEDFSAGNKKCDVGTKKSCTLVDSKYNWGEAECLEDCSGWEKSECVKVVRWGSSSAEVGNSMVIDKSNNIYFTGYTFGSIARPNNSKKDIILTKLDSSLNEIWTKQFGSDQTDRGEAIAQDSAGNIYIAGYTDGKIGEDPNVGDNDAFLMKVDSVGQLKWTRQLGSTGRDEGRAITVKDNVVYVGTYAQGSIDGEEYHGKYDLAISKFDTDGSYIWSKQFGTVNYDSVKDLGTDTEGNIIVAGYVGDDLNGQECFGRPSDILTMKLSSDGNEIWTKITGVVRDGWDLARSVSVSPEDNIYISGNFGPVILIKYSSDGKQLWERVITTGEEDESHDTALDKDGNFYMTGHTKGVMGKRPFGMHDIWVAKYDKDGSQIWKRQFGGEYEDRSRAIFFDNDGNLYLGGHTKSSMDGKERDDDFDFLIIKIFKEDL